MTQGKTQGNNKNLPDIATSHCLLCNTNTQLFTKLESVRQLGPGLS